MTPEQMLALLQLIADLREQVNVDARVIEALQARIAEMEAAPRERA